MFDDSLSIQKSNYQAPPSALLSNILANNFVETLETIVCNRSFAKSRKLKRNRDRKKFVIPKFIDNYVFNQIEHPTISFYAISQIVQRLHNCRRYSPPALKKNIFTFCCKVQSYVKETE